jgi:hypothetical protein
MNDFLKRWIEPANSSIGFFRFVNRELQIFIVFRHHQDQAKEKKLKIN